MLGFLLLSISCDRSFSMSGKVVDETTNMPIVDVKIVTSESVITLSDSSGCFRISRFGPGSKSDKLEMLLSKDGYETKYFDLSRQEDFNK